MTTIVVDIENGKVYTDGFTTQQGRSLISPMKDVVVCSSAVKLHSMRYKNGEYHAVAGAGIVVCIEKFAKRIVEGKRLKWFGKKHVPTSCNLIELKWGSGPTQIISYDKQGRRNFTDSSAVFSGSGQEIAHKYYEQGYSVKQSFEKAVLEDPSSGGRLLEWDISGRWWDEDKC